MRVGNDNALLRAATPRPLYMRLIDGIFAVAGIIIVGGLIAAGIFGNP